MPGDDGFEVPTSPIAPGQGGRPRLIVGLIAAALVAGFLIARWSPGPPSSEAATPGPTLAQTDATASPIAVASPLPERQVFSAPEAPLDDVLLEAGSVRRLRLARARLTDDAIAQPGRDLVLPGRGGETVCLCWQPSGTEAGDPRWLDLVRHDRQGRELARSMITRIRGLDIADPDRGLTTVGLEPTPDGRRVILARAVRAASRWQVRLELIDLAEAAIVDRQDLIDDPAGDGSQVDHVDPPTLRIAPDGRHLLVASAARRERPSGPDRVDARAWIVRLGDRGFGRVTGAAAVPDPAAACDWIDFVRADLIAQGCRVPIDAPEPYYELRRYGLDGRDLGRSAVSPWLAESGYPLVDVERGVVYGWDPSAHTLSAVDVATGTETVADATDEAQPPPTGVEVYRDRPPEGPATTWATGRATTAAGRPRSLVGSADGRLLFAIGDGPVFGASSGVWVFDAETLETIERWPPLASYASLAVLEDGRWLAAIGRPGVTSSGDPAEWASSLAIHDIRSGRPVLRLGDLGADDEVTFAWSEPPVTVQ